MAFVSLLSLESDPCLLRCMSLSSAPLPARLLKSSPRACLHLHCLLTRPRSHCGPSLAASLPEPLECKKKGKNRKKINPWLSTLEGVCWRGIWEPVKFSGLETMSSTNACNYAKETKKGAEMSLPRQCLWETEWGNGRGHVLHTQSGQEQLTDMESCEKNLQLVHQIMLN